MQYSNENESPSTEAEEIPSGWASVDRKVTGTVEPIFSQDHAPDVTALPRRTDFQGAESIAARVDQPAQQCYRSDLDIMMGLDPNGEPAPPPVYRRIQLSNYVGPYFRSLMAFVDAQINRPMVLSSADNSVIDPSTPEVQRQPAHVPAGSASLQMENANENESLSTETVEMNRVFAELRATRFSFPRGWACMDRNVVGTVQPIRSHYPKSDVTALSSWSYVQDTESVATWADRINSTPALRTDSVVVDPSTVLETPTSSPEVLRRPAHLYVLAGREDDPAKSRWSSSRNVASEPEPELETETAADAGRKKERRRNAAGKDSGTRVGIRGTSHALAPHKAVCPSDFLLWRLMCPRVRPSASTSLRRCTYDASVSFFARAVFSHVSSR